MPLHLNLCFRSSTKRQRTRKVPSDFIDAYIDRISIIESSVINASSTSISNYSITSIAAVQRESQTLEPETIVVEEHVLNEDTIVREESLNENSAENVSEEQIGYTRTSSLDQSTNESGSEELVKRNSSELTSDEQVEPVPNSSLEAYTNDSNSSSDTRYALLISSSVGDENEGKEGALKLNNEPLDYVAPSKNLDVKKHNYEGDLHCSRKSFAKPSSSEAQSDISTKCSSDILMTPMESVNADSIKSLTKQELYAPSDYVSILKTSMRECSVEMTELKINPHLTAQQTKQAPVIIIHHNEMIDFDSENSQECCSVNAKINNTLHDFISYKPESRSTKGDMWSTKMNDYRSGILEVESKYPDGNPNDELRENVTFLESPLSETVQRPVEFPRDNNHSAGDSMIEEIKESTISISTRSSYADNDVRVFDLVDRLRNKNYIGTPKTEIIGIILSNVNKDLLPAKDEELRDQMNDLAPTECSGDYTIISSEAVNKDMSCRMADQLLKTAAKTSEIMRNADINERNTTGSYKRERKPSNKHRRPRNVLHSFLNLKIPLEPHTMSTSNTASPLLGESSRISSDSSPYTTNLHGRDNSTDAVNLNVLSPIQEMTTDTDSDYENRELDCIYTDESSTVEEFESDVLMENFKNNHTLKKTYSLHQSELSSDYKVYKTEYNGKEGRLITETQKNNAHKGKVVDQVIKSTRTIEQQNQINNKATLPLKTYKTIQPESTDKDINSCPDEFTHSIEDTKRTNPIENRKRNRANVAYRDHAILMLDGHFRRKIRQKIQHLLIQAVEYYHTHNCKLNRPTKDSNHHYFEHKRDDIIYSTASNSDTCAIISISQLNRKDKTADNLVDFKNKLPNERVIIYNTATDENLNVIHINNMPKDITQKTADSKKESDIPKHFENYGIGLEVGEPLKESLLPHESKSATVSSLRNSNNGVKIRSKRDESTEVSINGGNNEFILNLNNRKGGTAIKCSGDIIIVRDDTSCSSQISSPITIRFTKRSTQGKKHLETSQTLDSQCNPTGDVLPQRPLLLDIKRFEERRKNLDTYNHYKTEALKPMKHRKRTIPIKHSGNFEFTLSSLGKKFTTYEDPVGRNAQKPKPSGSPELHESSGQARERELACPGVTGIETNTNNIADRNYDPRYIYSPTNYRAYRRRRSHEYPFAIPSYKTPIRRILDASKALRSHKYSLNINQILPPADEKTQERIVFNKPKLFLVQDSNCLGLKGHEMASNRHVTLNNKQLVDKHVDFESSLNDSGNQLKSTKVNSPENLRSIFDETFKRYARKGKNTGDLISYKRSTEWLTDAGIVGDILSAEEANTVFKEAAGVKVALNKCDYRRFLYKLTRLKRINYNEIYERLCGANEQL